VKTGPVTLVTASCCSGLQVKPLASSAHLLRADHRSLAALIRTF
jgi:hypothetical protein